MKPLKAFLGKYRKNSKLILCLNIISVVLELFETNMRCAVFFTNRGSRWSLLLVPPASRAPVLSTGAPSCRMPPPHLPPPFISTPHQLSPTSPAPTLTPPPIIPPPLFHISTPPSLSASSLPLPSFAPPDPGPPAPHPPRRPPPHYLSAHCHRRASVTCRPPARNHMHTFRANQLGMNMMMLLHEMFRQTAFFSQPLIYLIHDAHLELFTWMCIRNIKSILKLRLKCIVNFEMYYSIVIFGCAAVKGLD